ncbi:MAG: transposase [Thermoanaerobaculia bacterium]
MAAVARLLGEHDTRLWRVVHHYVDRARAAREDAEVTRVEIDETAARRGHDYISVFVDLDVPRVLFATEGRDHTTVEAFGKDLKAHGGDPASIEEVCSDMSDEGSRLSTNTQSHHNDLPYCRSARMQ